MIGPIWWWLAWATATAILMQVDAAIANKVKSNRVDHFYSTVKANCQVLSEKSGAALSVDYCVQNMTRNSSVSNQ
jgi:hypothetical protein